MEAFKGGLNFIGDFHYSSCVLPRVYSIAEMMADSSRSSSSKRVQDFLPSVKPSYISIISLLLSGILWMKNDATNERLSMLETTSPQEIQKRGGFANGYAQEMSLRSMAESRVSPFERKSQQDVSKTLHYSLGKNVLVTLQHDYSKLTLSKDILLHMLAAELRHSCLVEPEITVTWGGDRDK